MHMQTESESTLVPLVSSGSDQTAEEIFEIAVRLVMEVGLAAAEEFLHSRSLGKSIALKALCQTAAIEKKPR